MHQEVVRLIKYLSICVKKTQLYPTVKETLQKATVND